MKINTIMELNEAIMHVPDNWIAIYEHYIDSLKYAYVYESDVPNEDNILSMLNYRRENHELNVNLKDTDKVYPLVKNVELKDERNEVPTGDTTVTLAVTNNRNVKSAGSYSKSDKLGNIIVINLHPLVNNKEVDLLEPKEAFKQIKRKIKTVIENKLVNLIEREIGNEKQLKKNNDYDKHKDEYLKSPAQFNSEVIKYIRNIENEVKETSLSDENIKNIIKRSTMLDTTVDFVPSGDRMKDAEDKYVFKQLSKPNEFLKTLKTHKPKQWKRAVKSIMVHFDK